MLGVSPGESLDWALFPATTHHPSPVVSFFQGLLSDPVMLTSQPTSCRGALASAAGSNHETLHHDVPRPLLHYTENQSSVPRVFVEGEEVEEFGWGKAKRD